MATITKAATQAVRVSLGAKYNNYDNDELRVGVQSTTATQYMSLVQFDVSSISSHAVINSAYLKLYSYSDACWRASVTQLCQRVTSSWSESGANAVTYNTKPSVTTANQASHTTSGNYDTWEEWNVKDIVQLWVSGTANYGFWLIQDGLTIERGKAYKDEDQGSLAPQLVISYTVPTSCGAPSSCSVSPTVAESSATLSWSGASAGTLNSITGYDVQYADSSNGSTWGSWQTLTSISTSNSYGSLSISPHSTRGYYRRYQVRTKGSAGSSFYSSYKVSTNTLKKNTAPNTVSGTPTLNSSTVTAGEAIRVSFANAGDADGNLAGYEVAMQYPNGSWYGSPTILSKNTSGSATYVDVSTTGWTSGAQWKFLVRGYDSFGIRGSWSAASALVTIGDVPSVPRSITYSGGISNRYESSIQISWSAPSTTYGLSYTYEIRLGVWNDSGYTWGSPISTGTTASYSWNISGYSRGQRLYAEVRAVNTVGSGNWNGNGTAMYYNQIPNTPTIAFPKSSGITYNTKPRIGFKYGTDADSHSVRGLVTLNSITKDSNTDYWSNQGTKTIEAQSLVQGWELAANTYVVYAKEHDGLTYSNQTQRTFTVANPNWTDATIIPKVTPVKAVHITELRQAIHNVCDYYGLTKPTFTDTLTGGTSPIKAVHITELRQAIEDIRTYVNSYDSSYAAKDIEAFNWTDSTLVNTRIKSVHITELRQAIIKL